MTTSPIQTMLGMLQEQTQVLEAERDDLARQVEMLAVEMLLVTNHHDRMQRCLTQIIQQVGERLKTIRDTEQRSLPGDPEAQLLFALLRLAGRGGETTTVVPDHCPTVVHEDGEVVQDGDPWAESVCVKQAVGCLAELYGGKQ